MHLVIQGIAILLISFSLSCIIVPATIKEVVRDIIKKNLIWIASAIRLVIGISFLFAASESSMKILIYVLGGVFIVAAISLPILGKERIESIMQRWLNQKDWRIRIWGFFGMLFGITLALAGMPI